MSAITKLMSRNTPVQTWPLRKVRFMLPPLAAGLPDLAEGNEKIVTVSGEVEKA
jgi:hypothetical protein